MKSQVNFIHYYIVKWSVEGKNKDDKYAFY